ncbi:ABC transporter substrate-binding protein, partial [Francisella tularensis subsp. holarctica]|nr:ABC transporter substrate-binding protein [Francisella tularensis subsp. holarctica]
YKQVKVLFYNKQDTDNVTSDVLEVAKKNNIPVVGITETMPVNYDAIKWMIETLQATAVALDKVQK